MMIQDPIGRVPGIQGETPAVPERHAIRTARAGNMARFPRQRAN